MVRGESSTSLPSGGISYTRAAISSKSFTRSPCSRRALTSEPSTPTRHSAMARFVLSSMGPGYREGAPTNGGIEPSRRAVPRARGARRSLHQTKAPLQSVDDRREIREPPAWRRLRQPRMNVDQLEPRRLEPHPLRDGFEQGATTGGEEQDE